MNEFYAKMIAAVNQDSPNYAEFKSAFDGAMLQKMDNHFEAKSAELFNKTGE